MFWLSKATVSLSESFENNLAFLSTDKEYITTPAIVTNIQNICKKLKSEEHAFEQNDIIDDEDDEQISIIGRIFNLQKDSEKVNPVVPDSIFPETFIIDIIATPKKSRMRKFDSKTEGAFLIFVESRKKVKTRRGMRENNCFQKCTIGCVMNSKSCEIAKVVLIWRIFEKDVKNAARIWTAIWKFKLYFVGQLKLNDVRQMPTTISIMPKNPMSGIFCLKYANSKIESKITPESE